MRIDVLADRLETLERSRGTIMSQVSHDLRSPLALIRAYAWTLRKGEPSKTRSDRLLTIEEEAQGMAVLIDDLLLLGRRSAAPPVEGAAESADIGLLAERVIGRRSAQALDDGLALELELPDEPAMVAIRAGGLERIVANLVENALRHATSTVTVRIEVVADEVVLSCEDDGPRHPARRDRAPVRAVLARRCRARERVASVSRSLAISRLRAAGPSAPRISPAVALGWSCISRAPAPWWVGSRDAPRSRAGARPRSRSRSR